MHFIETRIVPIPNDFREKLIEFIQEKYGSLRKFSKALGYSVSYISAIINDKKNLTIDLLMKIDDLGFHYDYKSFIQSK